MSPRRYRATARARFAAVALAAGLVSLVAAPAPAPTEAGWVAPNPQYASGSVSTLVVPQPTITSCTASGVLGIGATATVKWKFPSGSGYVEPTNVQFWFANSSLLGDLLAINGNTTTTGPDTSGEYSTKFGTGLLTNLLGGKALLGVSSKLGTWTSVPVIRTATWSLLNSCS